MHILRAHWASLTWIVTLLEYVAAFTAVSVPKEPLTGCATATACCKNPLGGISNVQGQATGYDIPGVANIVCEDTSPPPIEGTSSLSLTMRCGVDQLIHIAPTQDVRHPIAKVDTAICIDIDTVAVNSVLEKEVNICIPSYNRQSASFVGVVAWSTDFDETRYETPAGFTLGLEKDSSSVRVLTGQSRGFLSVATDGPGATYEACADASASQNLVIHIAWYKDYSALL